MMVTVTMTMKIYMSRDMGTFTDKEKDMDTDTGRITDITDMDMEMVTDMDLATDTGMDLYVDMRKYHKKCRLILLPWLSLRFVLRHEGVSIPLLRSHLMKSGSSRDNHLGIFCKKNIYFCR